MNLDNVFGFIIDFLTDCISWVYNLSIPLSSSVEIPLGLLLISFVVFGLLIKFLFSIFS